MWPTAFDLSVSGAKRFATSFAFLWLFRPVEIEWTFHSIYLLKEGNLMVRLALKKASNPPVKVKRSFISCPSASFPNHWLSGAKSTLHPSLMRARKRRQSCVFARIRDRSYNLMEWPMAQHLLFLSLNSFLRCFHHCFLSPIVTFFWDLHPPLQPQYLRPPERWWFIDLF